MEPWLVSCLGKGVCPPLLESTTGCLECARVKVARPFGGFRLPDTPQN